MGEHVRQAVPVEETRGGEEPGDWKVTDQKWQGLVEVGGEVAADFEFSAAELCGGGDTA